MAPQLPLSFGHDKRRIAMATTFERISGACRSAGRSPTRWRSPGIEYTDMNLHFLLSFIGGGVALLTPESLIIILNDTRTTSDKKINFDCHIFVCSNRRDGASLHGGRACLLVE